MLLPSGKTPANKYDLKALDPTKILPDLDIRILGALFQRVMEETYGYSIAGNLGSSAAFDENLCIITKGNIDNYATFLAKLIQTYVANNSFLDVDNSSTANSIILKPRKISDINSLNGNNYSKETSMPFSYRDNLKFTFRAKDTNTNSVQFQFNGLNDVSGAIDGIDELGNSLPANSIIAGRYYDIILTTVSTVKKVIVKDLVKATLAEAIAGTNNTKFLTPYLASNLPAFRAAKTSPQTLTNSVWTKITGLTVSVDIGNYYNAGNSRYTPPAGEYLINMTIEGSANGSSPYSVGGSIYINGAEAGYSCVIGASNTRTIKFPAVSNQVTLNGTQYLEFYARIEGTDTLTLNEISVSATKIR